MRWLRRLIVVLRSMFRRRRVEAEIDAELQFHLDREIADNVARGMSAAEASAAARRALGSVAVLKDECRESLGLRLVDELSQDLRYALRTLYKNPTFAVIAVLTLALGIGANASIFTLLDDVVLKPLPVPAAGELMVLYENGPDATQPPDATGGTGRFLRFSYPRFQRLDRALGADGALAAFTRSASFLMRAGATAEPRLFHAQLVSGTYFSTLGVSAARGRVLTPDDVRPDRPSTIAVVSDGFWKRVLGGTAGVVGREIGVNGVTVTIVGVAPPGFAGVWTDSEADAWLPLTLQTALHYANNSSSYGTVDLNRPWLEQDAQSWLNLVARIPRAARARAVAELQAADLQGTAALAATITTPRSRTNVGARTLAVEPFAQGFSGLRARFADALFALAALVALVLLVTCANIANLLLARGAAAARDVGVRLALGATTARLVRQALTESLTIALAGGAAGLLLGRWSSRFLARQALGTRGDLPIVFSPDARVLAFTIVVSLAAAVAFGLAPALRTIRATRTSAVAGNQRTTVGRADGRGMRPLVVGQLAVSVVVVFAAVEVGRTLVNLTRVDPGFAADRLVSLSFDAVVSGYSVDQLNPFARRIVDAARAVPGVAAAAASHCGLVANCSSTAGFRLEGSEPQEPVTLSENWVTPGYFSTVGVAVVSGREFDARDTDRGRRVAIVNESVARQYFARRNPVGRRLGGSQPDIEIVGVVRDARTQSVHDAPVPMVYFPMEQRGEGLLTAPMSLDVRVAGDPAATATAIQRAIRRSEPGLLLGDAEPMTMRLSRDLSRERLVAALATAFGVLTLLLASLGLYGVLSYGVVRRTQEIGVRVALGAPRGAVVRLVLGQGAALTAAGLVFGGLGAAAGARGLARILFGVSALDLTTVEAVLTVFAIVAACASYFPARRATRVDPIVALRCE